jgi:uncharacterized protein
LPKFSLVPREKKFFILFQQGAENGAKMARELKDLVYLWQNVEGRVSVIADLEQDGDAITHEIMSLLNRTFIPPFDREDISALASSLDDIADRIHSAADAMLLYRVGVPTTKARELADIILQAAAEVKEAVSEIGGNIDKNRLFKYSVEINRLENLGDNLYRAALAELFANTQDIANLVKWREIYEDMELAINGCETVASVLEGVGLKYS